MRVPYVDTNNTGVLIHSPASLARKVPYRSVHVERVRDGDTLLVFRC